jgi:histidine ammonia-lyase
MDRAFTLGAEPLTLERLDARLGGPLRVQLDPVAMKRVDQGRAWVEQIRQRGEAVYGINTGFGHLKGKHISPDQLERLQENLLISHAVGVGPPAPPDIVRWMLLLKIHMLLAGHSGVRPELIERLSQWLNRDLLPVVPTRGSLGASGDLAPLAHLFLPLLGMGAMSGPIRAATVRERSDTGDDDRQPRPAADVLREQGLEPLQPAAKEGLALINGTQFMSAYAANIAVRARRLADLADLILCMSLEGLRGSVRPMDQRLHVLRAHAGAQRVAENVRRHMAGSEILKSHEQCEKVQDPYSLRCAPQVHGAFRDALDHFCGVVQREINSVTDNPILFGPGSGFRVEASDAEAISGGNFHGAPLALVLDYLAMALTDLASISERRVYLLLAGEDDLPRLLMRDTGLNSGFMLPQYTAAALVNECKVLATPASVDTIPTSLGQEDHVSMGGTSALKCYEIIDRAETVLAIEMMCAAQAIDYRQPLKPGVGPRAAHALIRKHIPHTEVDRAFGEDIHTALRLVREQAGLRAIARDAAS